MCAGYLTSAWSKTGLGRKSELTESKWFFAPLSVASVENRHSLHWAVHITATISTAVIAESSASFLFEAVTLEVENQAIVRRFFTAVIAHLHWTVMITHGLPTISASRDLAKIHIDESKKRQAVRRARHKSAWRQVKTPAENFKHFSPRQHYVLGVIDFALRKILAMKHLRADEIASIEH